MRIGFLGFGEVASILSEGIIKGGGEVFTCVEDRSPRTKKNVEKVGVNLCQSNIELAEISDILISAVVPAQAVEVAQEVGEYCRGVYVDINNISAPTVKKALDYIEHKKTVDATIMGGIKRMGWEVPIISSGNSAPYFAKLNNYGLNIRVIGTEIGRASTLKMLRSSYTKGVSALLFESVYAAYRLGMDEELLRCLEGTECPGFRISALSRINNSAFHARRKSQEMDEVLKAMGDHRNLVMIKAAAEFFKSLSKTNLKWERSPEIYREIFRNLDSL